MTRKWWVRRWWRRSRRFISAFSASEDDEGEGVELREETTMDEDGQDMFVCGETKRRWEFMVGSQGFYTFGCPAIAGVESINSANSSGAWRSLCVIHESSEWG